MPGTEGTRVDVGGMSIGLSVCEDAWHDAQPFAGYAGTAADREHQRLAVPPGQDRRTRGDAPRSRAPDRSLDRLRERRRWPGRAGLRRRLDDGRARRHRPPPRHDVHRGPADRRPARRRVVRRPAPAPGRPRTPRRSGARSCSASATTCGRTGSTRSSSACRAASTPRSSPTLAADALGADAVRALAMPSPFSSPESLEDAVDCARSARHPPRHRRDHEGVRRVPLRARRALRRARGGRHRGEPAGPHPREPADGDVEQVRLDRARHREQERVRGGLLDPVRRHGGRLRADQGRAEDPRVRAGELAERTPRRRRRDAADPRAHDREAAERRAPARPEGHRLAAALRRARPGDRGLRRGRPRRRRHGRRRHRSGARRARRAA